MNRSVIFLLAFWLSGCDGLLGFSSEPLRGVLFEKMSGMPIEGAVIVASWQIDTFHASGRYAHIAEATSDAAGRFEIPAWRNHVGALFVEMNAVAPSLWIFKRGFKPIALRNDGGICDGAQVRCAEVAILVARKGSRRPHFYANNAEFRLENESSDLQVVAQNLNALGSGLGQIYLDINCSWTSIPKMLRLLSDEKRRLASYVQPELLVNIRYSEDFEKFPKCRSTFDLTKHD